MDKIILRKLKKLLIEKNYTISCAESCTGGLLAKTLTDLPGSSAFFKGAIVAYSNEIKEKILNVSKSTLQKHGAVSKECAFEMANMARKKFETSLAISTTGIAGPDGGTKEKKVGLVFAHIQTPDKDFSFKYQLNGSREDIRTLSVQISLENLFDILNSNNFQ